MDGKTIERIVTRKQYSHGLTVSSPRLVSNYRDREKGYFTVERSDNMVSTKSPKLASSKMTQLKTLLPEMT